MTPSDSSTFSSRPFAAAPDPARYFPAAAMEEARCRVGRSVQRGEGPIVVIGAAGLGKTLLLQVIAKQFGSEMQAVQLVGGQLCTRRSLLQMVLFQLNLPYRGMDESELRLSLLDYLQPQQSDSRRILLLVDEADAMPPRLLEELRALTNLSNSGQLLVNLVLVGNAKLEEQFADPKLELFSQRISARCYLSALGREETFQYIRAQVTATGKNPEEIFTDDGLEAVFAATDGVPRLVNQLCDQLMWTVSETGYLPLDSMIVQQAWSELQQLPAPWNTQEKETMGSAVEFGELDSQHEIAFEEVDLSEDQVEEGYDDDLPASIPISLMQTDESEQAAIDLTSMDTIDVTEQLLVQLNEMDTAEEDTTPQSQPAPANNPFAEAFESEELVLDRYAGFEDLMLAAAPKVENLCDIDFSHQLQQYETLESTVTDTPLQTMSVEVVEPTTEPPTSHFSNSISATDPGELLVIEEGDSPVTSVVDGQRFRQLFSSLESSGDGSCFG